MSRVSGISDAEDIFIDDVIGSSGGTIIFTIDTRRKFMPGNYAMHVVGPDPNLDEDHQILCREDVDPALVHELLINSNCDQNHKDPEKSRNFISRYDWMHFRNWGDWSASDDITEDDDCDDDEIHESMPEKERTKRLSRQLKRRLSAFFNGNPRNLVLFVNTNNMDDILGGRYTFEHEIDSIFIMKSNQGAVIGFIIQVLNNHKNGFNGGDWNYGCMLTDKSSNENFAFIFGDVYRFWQINRYIEDEDDEEEPVFEYDIQNDAFTYNIEKFQYKK